MPGTENLQPPPALVSMVLELVPACVVCWNGSSCKWLSVGACRFGHRGMEAEKVRQAVDGGESGLDVQVRELRDKQGVPGREQFYTLRWRVETQSLNNRFLVACCTSLLCAQVACKISP